jgi:hypothetical protein
LKGLSDVGGVGERRLGEGLAGAGIDDRGGRPTYRLDVLTAHEVAQFSQCHSPDIQAARPHRPTVTATNIAEDFPNHKGIPSFGS